MDDLIRKLENAKAYMKGNPAWEAGWLNYPDEPARSPADEVLDVINALKAEKAQEKPA